MQNGVTLPHILFDPLRLEHDIICEQSLNEFLFIFQMKRRVNKSVINNIVEEFKTISLN